MESQLTLDPDRSGQVETCPCCAAEYALIKGFLYKDDDAYAIYFAALHHHDGVHEAWMNVILGSFGEDDSSDHETFGCRVGPIDGQEHPAASAVDAATTYSDEPIWGRKLSSEAALGHVRLADFWEVVDFVLANDPDVNGHVYGPVGPQRPDRRGLGRWFGPRR